MWKFIRSTIPLANMTMDTVNKMLETRQRGSQFIMLSDKLVHRHAMSDREHTRWQHNRIYPHPISACVYTYD